MKHLPIKILFLIDELNIGGTEKQLIWLAENLPRDQFDPTIGVFRKTLFQKTLSLKTPIIDFEWFGFPVVKNFLLLRKIYKYLNNNKIDILQMQFVESEIYSYIATYFCKKRPFIIATRRNMYHWISNDYIRFAIARYFSKYYDHILVNSHAVKQRCQEIEGIPPEKITVIQNAVEIDRFKNIDTPIIKKRFGFDTEQFVVGIVGNWRAVKGNATFLQAAAYISQQIEKVVFVLVGNGPQEQELRKLAESLHIENRTMFIPDVSDVSQIIGVFDIAVQSSYSESFSNVLLEYMAAARPIVATRVGDADQMIKHGCNGLLVNPGDPVGIAQAVVRLYNDMAFKKELGVKAAVDAEISWSKDTILKKYITFYFDAIHHGAFYRKKEL